MRRSIPALALALAFAVPASAGPKQLLKDWKFMLGEGVIATALVLDGASTCRDMSWGYVEGTGPARGSRSCGATAGRLVGAFAFYTGTHLLEHHFTHNDDRKWLRVFGETVIPVGAGAIHGSAAAHNYSLPNLKVQNAPSPVLGR